VSTRPSGYVPALDGLRGLAALVVVITHTSVGLGLPLSRRIEIFEGPLAPLLNADGAVQLFFVLSGYVLAGSLLRNRGASDLAAYGVKRIFRIHPPYVAAVALAWLLSFFYLESSEVSPFLRRMSAIHLDAAELLASLRFPGSAFRQLPPGWSLKVEMIFSLLLPAMLWIALRSHGLVLVALGAGALWLPHPWIFAIDFALGLAAYLERERLAAFLGALSRPPAIALVAISLALWTAPALLGWRADAGAGGDRTTIPVHALGSLGLVVLVAHRPELARGLALAPLAWLGRVSYSLYLVHFPLLLVLAPRLGGPADWEAGIALYAAVLGSSLLAAELGHRFVEVPSIRLGNAICTRIAARFGGRGVASERAPST